MNALDFMTRFEDDCLRFYETLGKDVQDRELGELYRLLADSQRKHLDALKRPGKPLTVPMPSLNWWNGPLMS